MMTHSCPIHGRYDITQTECPICEKLERDSRLLGRREAVASVLTVLLSMGCKPDQICYDSDVIGDDAPDNLKELVDDVFAADSCSIIWTLDDSYIGSTMLTPYENPGHVLCDYGWTTKHPSHDKFETALDNWSNHNGYE